LVAANAQIGAAKALYFPQVSLTGFLGGQSRSLSSLFTGPARQWTITPAADLSIFNAGKIRSNVHLTEATKREMIASYRKAIQNGFREVSDALIDHDKNVEQRKQQELFVDALKDSDRLAQLRYKGGLGAWDTPFLHLPGFDLIFFNVWRTVSCETLSTTSSATNFSANTRILQWACPSGQSLHARAMRCASARPSSRRFWPGRASSVSAPLNPRSTKRWRVRSTVVRAVSNALAMSSSVHPSLAFNRICARFIFRAEISPLCVICSNSVRST